MRNRLSYSDNEIEKGLYTRGGELIYDSSTEEYIGWYHRYVTGELYSLPSYIGGRSVKLLSQLDNSIIEYRNASNGMFDSYYDNISISPYSPFPDDDDYNIGYINRYFMKRRNDISAPISEISETDYNILNNNTSNFYSVIHKLTTLKWKISGIKHDKFNSNGVRLESGVYETNKRVLINTELDFNGITSYLSNLLQFYR